MPFRKAASLAWSNIRPNSSAPLRPYVPSKKLNILDPLHQQHSLKKVQEEDSQSEVAFAVAILATEERRAAEELTEERQDALRLAMAESVAATTSSSF